MLKIISHKFNNKEIRILPLSDVHVGDDNVDYELLKKSINYIRDNDDVFTVLNGDIFNQAIKSSVSFEHGATNPNDEYLQALKLFEPIKHKILMITLGNHDDRIIRVTGVDIMRIFARELGIEDRYVEYGGVLIVQNSFNEYRNKPFRMYFTHGIGLGGGRTHGAKINGCKRLSETITNCDLYCIGHVHVPTYTSDRIFYLDDKHNNLKSLTRHYVVTASFLNYGGYGQKYNFTPTSKELIEITVTNEINVSTIKL